MAASQGSSSRGEKLNIGILVPSASVPRWVATFVAWLNVEPRVRVLVFLGDVGVRTAVPPRVFRAYERVDARLFRTSGDALELVHLPPQRRLVQLEGGRNGVGLSSADAAKLFAAELDVTFDFAGIRADPVARAARYGVWRVEQTDEAGASADGWLFPSVRRRGVFRTAVVAERESETTILYESYGASDRISLHRARTAASWKGSAALMSRLNVLMTEGWAELQDLSRPARRDEALRESTSSFAVAVHVFRVGAGVALRRTRKLAFRDEWFVATRARPSVSTTSEPMLRGGFKPLPNPPRKFLADPFPFVHDGRMYLFFESYSHDERRGSIWVVRVDEAGHAVDAPRPVLERDYHLSYPFVFRHGRGVFMIPESEQNRTVDLYRAWRFPDEWHFERTLLSGLRAVDSTVHEAHGQLWLFANVAAEGASLDDELHLFFATDLTGPWRPHRGNPVVATVRSARPAGRLFRDGPRLIRPSQDCSDGYGGAIVLNRVDVLNTREYRETAIGRVEPTWLPRLSGTHTLNVLDGLEAIDGRRLRARLMQSSR
jgi:hypothetical protein